MAYREVKFESFPAYEFESAGVQLEGRIISRKIVESKKFKSGMGTFYHVRDMAGKDWSILGTNYLNALLKSVPNGAQMCLTYKGKKKLPAELGGNVAHEWMVQIDDTAPTMATEAAGA